MRHAWRHVYKRTLQSEEFERNHDETRRQLDLVLASIAADLARERRCMAAEDGRN
jgi:hypothetical protein